MPVNEYDRELGPARLDVARFSYHEMEKFSIALGSDKGTDESMLSHEFELSEEDEGQRSAKFELEVAEFVTGNGLIDKKVEILGLKPGLDKSFIKVFGLMKLT